MRRFRGAAIALCCALLSAIAAWAQSPRVARAQEISGHRLQQEFYSDFNLAASAADADELLRQQPGDVTALFIRMETAALQQRTDVVLDSALRLCSMSAPADIQEIASSRILENGANSRVFGEVVRRVGLAMEENNACTFNLRLALVAAAADGNTRLDLDKTADSAGLLTRWQIAGPFGRFSNVDFGRQWPPESEPFWRSAGPPREHFWFRDGMAVLPEYMSSPGVFYAAADVRTGAERAFRLDVLSPGPYTIFMDGKQLLTKDSRYAVSGNRESLAIQMKPGQHRIVMKFTADAAPFSVDLHPVFVRKSHPGSVSEAPAMTEYIRALLDYFRGAFNAVQRRLASDASERGPFVYIRALLWSAVEERSPRARAAWESLKQAEPSALLARTKALEFALDAEVTNEQRAEIRDLEQRRPDSEAVAQLGLKIAPGDSSATAQAFRHLLELHPTCTRLMEALKFYTAAGYQARAQEIDNQLSHCAPESLDYATVLSDSGRHEAAAALLEQKLAHNRLNRTARRMLVKQLALSGQINQAREEAELLHRIAPGSRVFAQIATDPTSVMDSNSDRGLNFVSGKQFYSEYRRSPLDLIRSAAQLHFPGSAATVLLFDRVLKIQADGGASLYVHRVTRLESKDGINHYGQVALPQGADLLELRTIKSNGQVIEPELTQRKDAISMPALEPGDSIEEEDVTHYREWGNVPALGSFEFGSVAAPVMHSRLVLLTPKTADINIGLRNGAPQPKVEIKQSEIVRTWEMEDMAALAAEPFSPDGSVLPTVSVRAREDGGDRLRDTLIDSTRIGPHVIEAALRQKFPPATGEREKARLLYRFVTSRIDSTGPDLDASAAEDSLSAGEGSRTAVLLALARARGLNAGLLMARRIDQVCTAKESFGCYSEPLVRFWADGEVIDADAESDGLPFGTVSAGLDPHSALLVRLNPPDTKLFASAPEFVALAIRPAQEQSMADGDLFLDANGSLTARMHVRLGTARSQEIRASLRSAGQGEIRTYFEQFAARIFPGATDVHGDALHLDDPEQPLEVALRCTVHHFISMQSGRKEISQLAPGLGLRMFAGRLARRRFPLFVDSVLFESTVFHLHLPAGVNVRALPRDFVSDTDFGRYAVRFSRGEGQLDVSREFAVPIQVVRPEQFPAFLEFATQIEAAEQQRIGLEVRTSNAETQSRALQ